MPEREPRFTIEQLEKLAKEARRHLQEAERGEIPPEVLEQNQSLFDFLDIKINLQEELKKGNILLPPKEQKEIAEKEGYTLPLIIPGHLPREELLNIIKTKYSQEFSLPDKPSDGVHYTDEARQDLPTTLAATQNPRPEKLYLLFLKPQSEVREAHLETMDKTFPQCQEILNQENLQNPSLNLKGLTLPEYLLADALIYTTNQQHLERETFSWLLEEQTPDGARCLCALWRPGVRRVGVHSLVSAPRHALGGARFAVLPQ